MDRNAEGYYDPTPGEAWKNICRKERLKDAERLAVISSLVQVIKQIADFAGFEVIGRIHFKDKKTGKEYR